MAEFEKIQSDINDVKIDVNELKTNVKLIKKDFNEMKGSITAAVEKISASMMTLAVVTEKLNNNLEEHKNINEKIKALDERIDEIEEEQIDQNNHIHDIRQMHDACISTRKKDEEEKRNSTFNKIKDKTLEWLFVIIVALVIFILASHLKEFVSFMNSNGTGTGNIPIP